VATIFKRREARPIPEGATVATYRGRPYATWTDARGKAQRALLNSAGTEIIQEAEIYSCMYFDERGKRRKKTTGCKDRKTAQEVANKIELDANLRKRGHIDSKAERYAQEARRPILEHLADFRAFLADKDNTAKHVQMTCQHIETIIQACKAEWIGDLTGAAVMGAIGDLRGDDKSLRTCNAYLRSVKAFTRWLRDEKRTPDDNLVALAGFNADTDRRYILREMAPEELAYLLATVETYTMPQHNLPGPDRAMAYRVALGTGFRSKELRSLTPESFDLDSDPPTVTVQAACSKRRRLDVQPIRQDLAEILRPWLADCEPGEHPFANMPEQTARMLRDDLDEARRRWLDEAITDAQRAERGASDFLQHKDAAGRVADFHGLRHAYISALVAGGASVKTAQELARHSTPNLTIGRYSHTRLHDIQVALYALPDLRPQDAGKEEQVAAATGTDGPAAHGSRSGSRSGSSRDAKPCMQAAKPREMVGRKRLSASGFYFDT